MLEFTLKRTPGFLTADGKPLAKRARAKADWSALERTIAALPPDVFLDRVSARTSTKMLSAPRNRPKVQEVKVEHDKWCVDYQPRALPQNDAQALVAAMRRVRNNLFHGGKEDPLEEPYEGDDEEWAISAQEVAELLLDLLDNHQLRPAGTPQRLAAQKHAKRKPKARKVSKK